MLLFICSVGLKTQMSWSCLKTLWSWWCPGQFVRSWTQHKVLHMHFCVCKSATFSKSSLCSDKKREKRLKQSINRFEFHQRFPTAESSPQPENLYDAVLFWVFFCHLRNVCKRSWVFCFFFNLLGNILWEQTWQKTTILSRYLTGPKNDTVCMKILQAGNPKCTLRLVPLRWPRLA